MELSAYKHIINFYSCEKVNILNSLNFKLTSISLADPIAKLHAVWLNCT